MHALCGRGRETRDAEDPKGEGLAMSRAWPSALLFRGMTPAVVTDQGSRRAGAMTRLGSSVALRVSVLRLFVAVAVLTLFPSVSRAGCSIPESMAVHVPLQAFDTWSTQHARQHSAREANPLHGDGNLLRMVAVKAPLTAGIVWGDCQLSKRGNGFKWGGRVALGVAYGLIVRSNLKQGKR